MLLTALPPVTVAILAPFTGRFATRIGFRLLVTIGPLTVAGATLAFALTIGVDPEPLRFVELTGTSTRSRWR